MKKKVLDPKAQAGSKKMLFDHIPMSAYLELSEGMIDGVPKYGKYNWFDVDEDLDVLVYINAALRHLYLYMAGEDYARDSGKHHITHAISGLSVARDAEMLGKLADTRKKLPDEALNRLAGRICGSDYAALPIIKKD